MRWTHDNGVTCVKGLRVDDPKFRCCGCCHVQTATICLGIYNLVTQLVCFCVLMLALLNPSLIDNAAKRYGAHHDGLTEKLDGNFRIDFDGRSDHLIGALTPLDKLEPLPTPLPQKQDGLMTPFRSSDGSFAYSKADVYMFTRRRLQSGDLHLAMALVFGLVIITVLLIYGSTKNRPVYLLPFFCFQVFDFILACFTAVGHYTYLPNIHDIIVNNPNMPYRNELMQINSEWVALSILVVYVLVLLLKSYLIGIVWSCYQYIQIKNGRWIGGAFAGAGDVEQLLLPPDYDAATKMQQAQYVPPPMYAQPPPGYSSN